MSVAWATVIAVGVATVAIKSIGPLALGGRPLPVRLSRFVELLAPAVLAALVASQTLGGPHRLVIDARAAGVAMAAVAVLLRAPVLVVILLAAVVAAAIRALG